MNDEIEISTFYSPNESLKAVVNKSGNGYIIDFYKDDVLLEYTVVDGKTLRYCEDMAENYCQGILSINKDTLKINGI